MALDADQIAGTLAARGLRLTRQRRAVLDAVAAASSSVSPVQVFDAARERCPELGLTTVYRTLELLSEIGALRRVHGLDHCEAFVPAGDAIVESRCEDCRACVDACPADCGRDVQWRAGMARDELFDAAACRRQMTLFGNVDAQICGICIAACPFTRPH